jgi:hypothetical protein
MYRKKYIFAPKIYRGCMVNDMKKIYSKNFLYNRLKFIAFLTLINKIVNFQLEVCNFISNNLLCGTFYVKNIQLKTINFNNKKTNEKDLQIIF